MAFKSVILLPFLVLGVLSADSILEDEADALKHFKNSITYDPTDALLDWIADSNHHCNWTGIECHDITKRVISIYLPETQLRGQISPFLGNLSSLEFLDLSYNSFTGSIPFQLGYCTQLTLLMLNNNSLSGPIPSQLGKLKNLQILDLGYNFITGSIPDSLCNCTSLFQLSLDNNKLTSTIPDRIRDLVNLRVFVAFDNLLEGSIPPSIGHLKELRVLILTTNKMIGEIPRGLGKLSNLERLGIAENKLSGKVPDDIFNCSSLEMLDMAYNNLTGMLKSGIGRLYNLQKLQIFGNSFFGPIPMEIGNLTSLIHLSIGENQFSGTIPVEISKISKLQSLLLDNNNLEGQVPDKIFELKQLTELYLMNNTFEGPILNSVSKLEMLTRLDLSRNRFNGSIEDSMTKLNRLTFIDLSHNRLTGSISGPAIAGLKNIAIYLNFSNNFLTGNIPNEFGNMEMVQAIDISNNNLSGGILVTFQSCRNLQSLDLSGNQLSGSVSDEIFPSLKVLSYINMSRNLLEGEIPESMGNLTSLTSVDLSQNKFNGTIPETFGDNLALKHLNLSFNYLKGRVPDTGVFKNSSAVGLHGNPSLCTDDTKSCAFSTRSNHSHHKSRKLVLILAVLGSVALLLALFLGVLCFRHVQKSKVKESEDPELKNTPGFTLKRFDRKELVDATDGFSETNILGTSSLSMVYKGTLPDGRMIAVKNLNFTEFSAESDKSFNKEMSILAKLRHRNLVKVVGYAWESGKLKAVVLEYMENGNLDKVIHDSGNEKLRWDLSERVDVLVSVSRGLVYLHFGYDFPIVHCDLKPSNILLDEKWDAHVSDFGTARILGVHHQDGSSVSSASTFQGTIGYFAPEFAYMRKVTTKVDVYSFGIIIMEFITRKRPTGLTEDDGTLPQLIEQALSNGMKGLIEIVDPDLDLASDFSTKHDVVEQILQLALCCTRPNPDDRPDMNKILSSLTKISKKVCS